MGSPDGAVHAVADEYLHVEISCAAGGSCVSFFIFFSFLQSEEDFAFFCSSEFDLKRRFRDENRRPSSSHVVITQVPNCEKSTHGKTATSWQ
jgi:hypothetical protein